MHFEIEESDEVFTTHAGLSLVGGLLAKTRLEERLNAVVVPGRVAPHVSNAEVAFAYVGLLCQGKSDFDHIEPFRKDRFFGLSLGLREVPSSPTLRQRLDLAASGADWPAILREESADLLHRLGATISPVSWRVDKQEYHYVPLDIDVSPFDNSETKKEGIGYTYKGFFGYAPIFAYLGLEGYAVNGELRGGSVHSQKGAVEFIHESVGCARRITDKTILLRVDSGHDSCDTLRVCQELTIDFIVKRNLRRKHPDLWLAIAQEHGMACQERPGKTVYRGKRKVKVKGVQEEVFEVFEVVERTALANGQVLIAPEIEVAVYYTSLEAPASRIIQLYREHGTMEQFHSELKTDLDIERLPSGKFATNNLVLQFALFAYNLLRFIGQTTLKLTNVPIRKQAQRRRIRTVIQTIITLAAKVTWHARRRWLRLGRGSPWLPVLQDLYRVCRA
jgi:hypothetical protein